MGLDRTIIRFRRLLEQHGEVLDLFADMKDKQSGDYILDRQYIEASLDRLYEEVRRILYDIHVICDLQDATGYEELDRLRSLSENTLQDIQRRGVRSGVASGEEKTDWETLALRELYKGLTRVPAQSSVDGDVGQDGTGPEASAESLAEWVGRAHIKAANWMSEHLPSASPAPTLVLSHGQGDAFHVRVFLLGGKGRPEEGPLRRLVREGDADTDEPLFFPLRYFLEGFLDPQEGMAGWQSRPADKGERGGGNPSAGLLLYANEDFLLLRLPSYVPVRLFGCSLSEQPRENLIYLYGLPLSSPIGPCFSEPLSSENRPFPAHCCALGGCWMYWGLRFSWAQGEERIRMFGQTLAKGMKIQASGTTTEDAGKSFLEGMSVFFSEMILPQKEVNA